MPRWVAARIACTFRSSPRGAPRARIARTSVSSAGTAIESADPPHLRGRGMALGELVGRRLDPGVGRVADPVGLGEELHLADRLAHARGKRRLRIAPTTATERGHERRALHQP